MRILFLNSNYKGEGTYNRCFRIARQLVRQEVQVTLMTVTNRPGTLKVERREEEGVHLIELPALSRRRDYAGYLLRPWIATGLALREEFDLAHAFTAAEPLVWLPAMALTWKRRWKPFPLLVDWDDWYSRGGLVELKPAKPILRPLTTYWEESLPRRADGVTVVSSALERRAVELGVPAEKIHRIGNGADPDAFERLDKDECRRRCGLPREGTLALYLGNYNQAVPLALQAFFNAAENRPDAHLVCLGDISIRHHHLESDAGLVRRAQADPRVHFAGQVPAVDVPSYLAAADVLLLPMADTLVERARFPIRLGDYLSAEKAIVASDVGEVGRILREHDCALLAKDPSDFTRRLADLLDDPDRRRRLGLLARRVAQNHFRWEQIAGQMLKLYNSLPGMSDNPQ